MVKHLLNLLGLFALSVASDTEILCPEVDGPTAVYILDPTNCARFYECSNGVPFLFTCPANLYFQPGINVCDWPENVDCSRSTVGPSSPPVTSTSSAASTTTTTTTSTSQPPTSSSQRTTTEDDNCSEPCDSDDGSQDGSSSNGGSDSSNSSDDDSGDGSSLENILGIDASTKKVCSVFSLHALRAHPSDCTKYIICVGPIPIVENCPKRYYFNSLLHVCVPPIFGKCQN